jgi:hypothetical protein
MNGTAITKISLPENCRWNGAEYYHVRVYIEFAKAVEIAEGISQAYNNSREGMYGMGG